MKKLIVIINPIRGDADLGNSIRDAKNAQQNALGVKQISGNLWLIDPHMSLPFFVALLHSANERGCDSFVYEVDDIIQESSGLSPQYLAPK
ncbi:MAG: hypothetical protein ABSB22_25410 [Thermodesulfobacteriota bacterium]|jgi:hypothetical protein